MEQETVNEFSVKSLLDQHAATNPKQWDHDRDSTVGASEVGQCLRKTWFAKHDVPYDPGYVDRYGAKLRGTLIEKHFWEPGLRSQLNGGVSLWYAGDDQRTLVDGYLSATSDGLVVSETPMTVQTVDVGTELVVEAKSIDPRVDLQEAKAEHRFQVQCQIGLLRHCTNHRPNYALISYVDASFLDDIHEYLEPFQPRVYEAAKRRALQIMSANDPLTLPAEGKMAGGKECAHCPFADRCRGVIVGAIPRDEQPLDDTRTAELAALVRNERIALENKERAVRRHAITQEKIKSFLRDHDTRKVANDAWSVTYFPVKGRMSLDRDAMTAAGIDLAPFEKTGAPSERLTVKLKTGKVTGT